MFFGFLAAKANQVICQHGVFERCHLAGWAEDWFRDYVFYAGFWLRFVVFGFLSPFNRDGLGHFEHLIYVKHHWSLPSASLGAETWQPPLYYFITALIASISENPKFIQMFSLATSVVTLILAREFIRSTALLKTREGKTFALVIVSLSPIFVTFGLYLSNDSLTTLLGFVAFYKSEQLLHDVDTRAFLELVAILTLGLLTKGQFLVITACLFPLACYYYWSNEASVQMRIFVCIAACGLLAFGSVKYIQNEVIYGRPFVCNMDFNPNWLREDQGTYQGLASIYDVNILKLVQKPILDKSTQHSIPLIFYGTFWYDYITEPGLIGNRSNLTRRIGSYLDAVGVFPAILLMFGVVIAGGNLLRRLIVRADVIDGVACLEFASAIAFLGNVSMLLLVFCKFDAWSTLQARSLFPTIIGAFVLCDFALKWTNTKMRIAPIFGLWQSAFIVGSFGYFLAECVLEIL